MKKYKGLLICNAIFFIALIAFYFLQNYLAKTLGEAVLSLLFLIFSFLPLVLLSAVGIIFAIIKLFSKGGTGKRFLLLGVFLFLELVYLVYSSLVFYYWLLIAVALCLALIVLDFIAWKKYPKF